MPMMQEDIRTHYEQDWKAKSTAATGLAGLEYSNAVEDAVLYPIYEELIANLGMSVTGGRVLDVGSGSGRWIRFFLERYQPRSLVGIDFTNAAIELLKEWHGARGAPEVEFRLADITDPGLDLGEPFDLVNVANVLFHIPEDDLFARALANLRRLVTPAGHIVTTEYLPRTRMRTEWMMVRSRYEFEAAVRAAGLRIAHVQACAFFANDPMGVDGPDRSTRQDFQKVRGGVNGILDSGLDEPARRFFIDFLATIERAALAFASERIAQVDLPSQKLVVLKRQA